MDTKRTVLPSCLSRRRIWAASSSSKDDKESRGCQCASTIVVGACAESVSVSSILPPRLDHSVKHESSNTKRFVPARRLFTLVAYRYSQVVPWHLQRQMKQSR